MVIVREFGLFLVRMWCLWLGMLIAGVLFLLYLASLSAWECEHHPVVFKSDFCQKIALMRMENDGS